MRLVTMARGTWPNLRGFVSGHGIFVYSNETVEHSSLCYEHYIYYGLTLGLHWLLLQ